MLCKTENVLYLNVPFDLRQDAKLYGCLWDKDKKLWYVDEYVRQNDILKFLCMTHKVNDEFSISPRFIKDMTTKDGKTKYEYYKPLEVIYLTNKFFRR